MKILSNLVHLTVLRTEHWHHHLTKVILIQTAITISEEAENIKVVLENIRKEVQLVKGASDP